MRSIPLNAKDNYELKPDVDLPEHPEARPFADSAQNQRASKRLFHIFAVIKN